MTGDQQDCCRREGGDPVNDHDGLDSRKLSASRLLDGRLRGQDTGGDPRHLFVYGTLMRASRSPYARLLQARARFVGEATARGRLYHLGRFPGAVFTGDCPGRIHGELFRLNGAALLAALDAYEGCGGVGTKPDLFYRDIIEVQPARGGSLAAWTYPYAGTVAGRPLIASGRFSV